MAKLSEVIDQLINDSEVMEVIGTDTPAPEQIKALHQNGLDLMEKVRQIQKIAQSRFDLARSLCKHPKMEGCVCRDCGYDWE